MVSRAINVQASRFALLNVDDDSDDESLSKSRQNKQQATGKQTDQTKKKNQKKKKEAAQTAELRNLAFKKKGGRSGGRGKSAGQSASDVQWQEWQEKDGQNATETYEKDLEQALLLSKVDFEETKQTKGNTSANGNSAKTSGKDKKRKSKKEKTTMSLEEFNNLDSKGSRPNSESARNGEVSTRKSVPPGEADPRFFDKIQNDASKEIRKEKIQEQYKKHYIVESARAQQYQEDIDKKDQEIETLKYENSHLSDELKQVKKRNLQLCHILSQGEMKDKSLVLEELEQLRNVQSELTQQVADLTTELEKERSKVRSLKTDLDKHEKTKGGKHGSKN